MVVATRCTDGDRDSASEESTWNVESYYSLIHLRRAQTKPLAGFIGLHVSLMLSKIIQTLSECKMSAIRLL